MAKNIILLSDGTGNSAAKIHRTNVWRMYRALDLTIPQDKKTPRQIAMYDDGVGSQQSLPLKALGSVFGIGLKRNVLELYSFLCQNYEDGDRIYLFGFSRGAFTIRMLAGLICHQGLHLGLSARETAKAAKQAFDAYRNERFPWGPLNFAKKLFGHTQPQLTEHPNAPKIQAIGVWDTVDAYGMPIDELTLAWDYFIHTLRFPDLDVPPNVTHAYHALAIDDERQTFHPTLWNESNIQQDQTIEQVWFAGAHSNVGGGYPKDELAYIALDWMMQQVEAPTDQPATTGLRFLDHEREEIAHHGYVHGHLYDARSGLGAYYRFKSRNIAKLCHDPSKGVEVTRPKIHESVLRRIQEGVVPYSPVGLPVEYDIAPPDSTFQPEQPQHAQNRANAMEHAWDVIGWRRILYFALLGTSLLLIGSRFFLPVTPGATCDREFCLLDPVLNVVSLIVPGLASGWIETLRQHPEWLLGFAVAFTGLIILRRHWTAKTLERAGAAWHALKTRTHTSSSPPTPPTPLPTTWTYWIRTNPVLTTAYQFFAKKALPFACMIVMVTAPMALISRIAFEARTTAGGICQDQTQTAKAPIAPTAHPVTFTTDSPCAATGITVEKGERYKITVANPENWKDGGVEATPDGFVKTWDSVKLAPFTPARRSWSAPWFSLMARIGSDGKERFVVGQELTFTAKRSGQLFLFVNDAVCGFCGDRWAWPYTWWIGKNTGTADITISRIPSVPPTHSIYAGSPSEGSF